MPMETTITQPDVIVESIERLVRARTGDTIKSLRVEVDGADILLSGQTSTFYCKQLATHAVKSVVSPVNLTNDIEVC